MKKGTVLVAGGAAFGVATTAFAGAHVEAEVPAPASMFVAATTDGCDNSPGPMITLEGELALSGIDARLIFRNNAKGTHERKEDVTVDISLVPDEVISFAKQPSLGGVGGNPWIYLQLYDDEWKEVSDRVLLGRCVQGITLAEFDFLHLADVAMDVTGDCSNNPGPQITLSGELSFGGINAVLSFQNSRRNPPHKRDEVVDVDFVILQPGESISFAKQPPLGGVGGNPRIYLQFVDSEGEALGKEIYLGKCVQLSK